jgi:Tfp pilus assembly pilus retraction ATPase PilT
MNNIYITPHKTFDELNKVINDVNLSYSLVEKWCKDYDVDEHNINKACDFTTEINNNRYRVHLYHSHRGWNAALRLLPSEILSFDELGIKEDDILNVSSHTGLTLFCGPTGAGKSTTMNTAIDALLQQNKLGVTVTIEDPIEYLHHKDLIFQREVGSHCESFKQGLIEAMRMTPKTIVIGEIRDSETALEAVRAGLNGHRVFATLHASNSIDAISRLWAFLDDQGDELLVQSLQGIVAQELILDNQNQKHCFYEVLKIDQQTKNLLTQILDKNNAVTIATINNSFYNQNQLTIIEKKKELNI